MNPWPTRIFVLRMTFYLLHNVAFSDFVGWTNYLTKKELLALGLHIMLLKRALTRHRSLEPLALQALGLLVLKEALKTKTNNSIGRLQYIWNFKMNYFCIPMYRGIYLSKWDNINKSWTKQTDIDQWSMHIEGVAVHRIHVKQGRSRNF